ncbi:rCG20915 [Rattus norvegicus]|uniref:RCG20915 n=2 Tax=Rattus norvegicus TaxID=10116 RepID=A6JEG1_RAT|nr:rCG20915 [Rattus norvegicus]
MDSLLAMPLQAFPFIKTQLGSAVVSNSAIEDTACRS